MFGFGRKPDHFNEFLEYLVDDWQMKARYAAAFLSAYRMDISVMHEDGLKRLDRSIDLSRAENRLLMHTIEPKDFAIVGQAYKACINDIRMGKHVNTDVETAIWAILWNRSDLLESIDPHLAKYINENQPIQYPNLFEDVFM